MKSHLLVHAPAIYGFAPVWTEMYRTGYKQSKGSVTSTDGQRHGEQGIKKEQGLCHSCFVLHY